MVGTCGRPGGDAAAAGALLPDQVARSLGLDRRTLQRHLAQEGTSFDEVLHATRARVVQRHLGSGHRTFTEVADLLGFTAASAFSRWFAQQFGVSPREWRRRSAESAQPPARVV